MAAREVVVKDNKGNVVMVLDASLFPLAIDAPSCTTVSGRKPYMWRLSYYYDEEKRVKDRTKIKGMVLS